jgi:5,10-methylenetetrahydromethanopterin reductase
VISPEFGIGLRGDRQPSEYGRLGRLAEKLGFGVVTVFADLGYQPPFEPLLEVAAATDRVRLGPSCLNPYTMHPVEIAGQVAAMDVASRGRAYLGLAKGAWLSSIGIAQPRPLRAIREAAAVVQLLLSGDASGYRGEMFTVEPGFRLHYQVERGRVPLLIGAWGERMAALAGEIADEVKVGGSANADLTRVVKERLAAASKKAGRRAVPGVVLGAVTVVDEDGAAARERARSAVAMYFEVVARLDPTVEVDEKLVREVGLRVKAGDHRGAGRLIPDHLLDRFAFSGSPRQVAAQARRIFDAGASRVEFGAPFGMRMDDGLRMLGEQVLPLFR